MPETQRAEIYNTYAKTPAIPNTQIALYTSGSSSTPKIACLSLEAMLTAAHHAAKALNITEISRYGLALPLYHVGGLSILFRAFLKGACVTTLSNTSLEHDLSTNKITHTSLVPTQLLRLAEPLPTLQSLLLGGGPLPTTLPDYPIDTSYGMTETSALMCLNGKPLPHVSFNLFPDGEIGVKTPSLFSGYYQNGTLHPPQLREGYFATGDKGTFQEGLLTITGRTDRMFISGGENIQPEEIETSLLSHENVSYAIVKAEDDSLYGKRPIAYVDYPFETELKEYLAKRLPKFKIPKRILPLSALGGKYSL